jgi:hypothetical protein
MGLKYIRFKVQVPYFHSFGSGIVLIIALDLGKTYTSPNDKSVTEII